MLETVTYLRNTPASFSAITHLCMAFGLNTQQTMRVLACHGY